MKFRSALYVSVLFSLLMFSLGVQPIQAATSETHLNAAASSALAEGGDGTYVVKQGDTLSRIAARFNVGLQALVAANQLANPDRLYVGQQLIIPGVVGPANETAPKSNAASTASSPGVAAPVANKPLKGLAQAVWNDSDRSALGIKWFYVWGWCDAPGCIPMVRAMESPRSCPPQLIVGNEPNAVEPYGAPIAPVDAAARVISIEGQCPGTRLIVGNTSAEDWSVVGGWGSGVAWTRAFLSEYQRQAGRPFSQILGAHCYTQQSASYCTNALAAVKALYGGEFWVTEFGVMSGDATQLTQYLRWLDGHTSAYAIYTNRQPHSGQGWEIATGVELVNGDGTFSPAGQVYAGW